MKRTFDMAEYTECMRTVNSPKTPTNTTSVQQVMTNNNLRELIAHFFCVNEMKNLLFVNCDWRKTICINPKSYPWCNKSTSLIVYAYVRKHLCNTWANFMTFSRLDEKQFIKIEELFKFKISCRHFSEIHYFAMCDDHEPISNAELAIIPCFTRLHSLRCESIHITDIVLQAFNGFTWLQELSIGSMGGRLSNKITDIGLITLGSLTGLQALSLSCCAMTNIGLSALKSLTMLKRLSIGRCHITDAGLNALTGLNALKILDLELVDITASGLTQLSHLKLQTLRFSGFFPEDADKLRSFTTLENLIVSQVEEELTDFEVSQIGQLTTLQTLSLSMCTTTRSGLSILKLKELTKLQILHLGDTKIRADEELIELIHHHLTALQELQIWGSSKLSYAHTIELINRIAPRHLKIPGFRH